MGCGFLCGFRGYVVRCGGYGGVVGVGMGVVCGWGGWSLMLLVGVDVGLWGVV